MTNAKAVLRICCWGSFRLYDAQGHRLELPSRKGMAMLAMLATAADGERTRSWLQDRLWGSRGMEQAQQSLRRELSTLKAALPPEAAALITADRERVRLALSQCHIDDDGRESGAQFLEGIDIRGEDGFEEWLREQRQRTGQSIGNLRSAAALPAGATDYGKRASGFAARPALAILPFTDATGDADGPFWAEGIGDELSERMARLRWLPVIAPSVLGSLRNGNLDALSVGTMTGAAYVLRGRLVRRGSQMALQLTLLDGASGRLLWSERSGIGAIITYPVLTDVADHLAATMASLIDIEQQSRVLDRPVQELDVDERLWRAKWHMNRLTRHDAAIARDLIAGLLTERPNSAEVLNLACMIKALDIWAERRNAGAIAELRTLAGRAIAADRFDSRGHYSAGVAEFWLRYHGRAEALFREAINLNPSLAAAYGHLGSNYIHWGQPARAFESLFQALRLSPLDNVACHALGEMALAHCLLGQWAEAVRHADLSIARRPAYAHAHVIKINALVRQGKAKAARQALDALHRARPAFLPSDIEWLPFEDGKWIAFLKEGIALAAAE